ILLLGRDRFGMEPLYFFEDRDRVVFGSGIGPLVRHPGIPKSLDYKSMHQFLLYCYNPTLSTFFSGVQKLRPAHVRIWQNGESRVRRYWTLSFSHVSRESEADLVGRLSGLLEQSIKPYLDRNRATGVFLSGGMDSSSVTALASRLSGAPIHTFSYRCLGESFDESPYAKAVSDRFGTKHFMVEYLPETVLTEAELVRHMDEPFCDVGINLATDLLGREAAGKVDLVLTGDGGDELFGGHPVYLADRAAAFLDRIPKLLTSPVYSIGLRLHDSDRKKDWKVKWKRFARSIRFPAELFSHRWRIYYTPGEIKELLRPDLSTQIESTQPYRDLFLLHREADGPDPLSRSLYSDYHTVVGFYLRRMDLVRRFGIEPRFPLLDRRLVEFCATIPSRMKIRNGSDVKAVFKAAMRGVLPDAILFRKDKLGHSIPLKNWMRNDGPVRILMLELLSESSINRRGFFQFRVVDRMIREHLAKQENHSHRLWALMVLELWLRDHWDR
ncbi:MAG TPA: asparagine synthase-related protein, partial [bacterium]